MLVQNPKKRYTALQVQKHPWFAKLQRQHSYDVNDASLAPDVFERLKGFQTTSYFEQMARNIMIKQTQDSAFEPELKDQFNALDKEGNGYILP